MAKKEGIDLTGLKRFQAELNRSIRNGQLTGPIGTMFKQYGSLYLTFVRRRFVRMSRGGWKPLAESTIKARRGGKRRATRSPRARTKTTTRGSATAKTVSILRDTNTLLNALTIGAPGNLYKGIRGGIRVGFGGPSRHPGGKATIRDIAVAHDEGRGKLPKREILVKPDSQTTSQMKRVTQIGIQRLGKKSERRV